MHIFKTLALLMLVPATANCTTANPTSTIDNSTYVGRMAAASTAAWPKLATIERLKKQTAFYADAQILVYDGAAAWLIDAKGYRPVEAEPVRALGLSSNFGNFTELTWEERPTVYIGLGQLPKEEERRMLDNPGTVPELFATATHEAFHFYGQAGWQLNAGERAERYPVQPLPRQYRQHVINALAAALRGEAGALGKARYWHDRWQTEFALEMQQIRPFDIVEGTAQYIDLLAQSLARGALDEPQAWAQRVKAYSSDVGVLSVDTESYVLGALAIYLLDGLDPDGWQAIIEGQTPVQRLLASVPVIVDVPDAALNQRIADAVSERNRTLESLIEPFITQLKHPDSLRLMIPFAALSGSVGLSGSYQVEQVSAEVLVGLHAQFLPTAGRITLEGATVAQLQSEACGEEDSFMMMLIETGQFPSGKAARLQLKSEGVEIDVPFPKKGKGEERIWCVRA